MKKILARELLWLVVGVALAFPLGFLFLHFLDVSPASEEYSEAEITFLVKLYFLGVGLALIGIYLVRLIVASLRVVTAPG